MALFACYFDVTCLSIECQLNVNCMAISCELYGNCATTIDGDEYLDALSRLLNKKATSLTEKDPYKRRYKLQQYAFSRGYEIDITNDILKTSEL